MEFELKLQSGKVVVWEGANAEEAAVRYVDMHPAEVVVAWRGYPRHGVFIWAGKRIIEAGDREDM